MLDLISTSSSCAHENDTISRRAAIDVIYKCTDIFINNLPPMIEKEDAYKALAALPSVQSEQRWISCSDRLPEYGEAVLTINEDGDYEVNHIIDEDNGEWFYEGAIAWMTLPPYKE